jgi:hypothetical membrane protein
MIDIVKKFVVGFVIMAAAFLFLVGIFSGGTIAWILLALATIAVSYILGSTVLDVCRANKQYKVTR